MKHLQKGPKSWSQDSPFFPSLWVGSTRWFSLKVQMRSLKRGRAPALVHKSFYYIRSVFEGNPECKHTMWKDNNGEEAPRINWRQLATLNKFSPPFPHSPTNSSHFVCFVCLLDFWSFPRRRQSKMPFLDKKFFIISYVRDQISEKAYHSIARSNLLNDSGGFL